jgi:ABC-type bacteriocin/lantibiotic exporter with double-glycine peptidase domain
VTGRLLLVLIALVASACSPFRQEFWTPEQVGLHAIEGVPFRPQEQKDDCGPSALASLLAYRGKEVSVGEISRAVYEPKLGGSLLPDMENFARRQGFGTRSGRGDLDLLRQTIDAGRPVVIPIETGLWRISRPHYLVIFGYDQRRFLAHAGVREGVFIDADDLLRRWEKMNRLYLFLE